jgi:HAD superfamily hydrolase (TIGR01549 family)
VKCTLLLDLDDTLLENPMDSFLPAYLHGLGERLSPFVKPDRMVKTLLAATQEMTNNTQPQRTLEATFESVFYPALGLCKDKVAPSLHAFYAEDFPKLRSLTQPKVDALELVKEAFWRGYRVAIATNPLFPRTAIEQRLAWAGLEDFPFELVPSFETMHFAKPNPAYFSELLMQMGWPDDPVVMIGDSLEQDILPAQQAGLAAYWVNPTEDGLTWPGGSLDNFYRWLDQTLGDALHPDWSRPSAVIAALRAAPAGLLTLAKSFTPKGWKCRPDLNAWCPTEIACHLRDLEREVNLPRVQDILRETNPFIPGTETDRWAQERGYFQQDGASALQAFAAARQALIDILISLPAQSWQRPARHAIFGPTQLSEIVHFIAEHDRLHIQQIKTILHEQAETSEHEYRGNTYGKSQR